MENQNNHLLTSAEDKTSLKDQLNECLEFSKKQLIKKIFTP